MKSSVKTKKGIDKLTVLLYTALVICGWINIYAVNISLDTTNYFDVSQDYFKQLIWIGISLIAIGIIMIVDGKFYVEFAYILYILGILLLIAVRFLGVEINGAKAWFRIGNFGFQPVELMKTATALAIAYYMSRFGFTFKKKTKLIPLSLIWVLPIALVIFQNDTGSALVFFSFFIVFFREGLSPYVILFGLIAIIIFILTLIIANSTIFLILGITLYFMLFIKGLRKETMISGLIVLVVFGLLSSIFYLTTGEIKYTVAMLPGFGIGCIYLLYKALLKKVKYIWFYILLFWGSIAFTYTTDYVFEKVLPEYQQTRIMVMLGLKDDPLGAGYNVNQSKIAIGSGGLLGKGFLQGTQTKFNFVPEQNTDFIFCTVGEEWGFVGTSIVVLLFIILLFRIIYLSELQHSDFSRIYGYCVTSIFFFHFAINIGMTIGLAPVIGIPLPFFSYGGSSILGFSILLFIFLKLDTYRNELIR